MNYISYDGFLKNLPTSLFEGGRHEKIISEKGLLKMAYLNSSDIYSLNNGFKALSEIFTGEPQKKVNELITFYEKEYDRVRVKEKHNYFGKYEIGNEIVELLSVKVDIFENPKNSLTFLNLMQSSDFDVLESIIAPNKTKEEKGFFAKFIYDAFKGASKSYDYDVNKLIIQDRDRYGFKKIAISSIAFLKSWSAYVISQPNISAKDAIYEMYDIFANHFMRIGSQKSLIDLSFKFLEKKSGDKDLYLKVSKDLKILINESGKIENIKYLDDIVASYGISDNTQKVIPSLPIKSYSLNVSFDKLMLLNDYKIASRNIEYVNSNLISVFIKYLHHEDNTKDFNLDLNRIYENIEGSISAENKELRIKTSTISDLLIVEKIFDEYSSFLPHLILRVPTKSISNKDEDILCDEIIAIRRSIILSKKIEEQVGKIKTDVEDAGKPEIFKL